ncbi:hypothetical protein [Kitasatospora sp. KL5]|uniref:hypothetical protein n=1 Tax=Kitasatospora sp. KL5 TaxID=3425125 RepID=UPI003D6E0D03
MWVVTVGQDRDQASDVQPSRRPLRSRVRHGQASCADYGCTRATCRQAALRARRRRDTDRAQGLAARVDAAPAALRAAVLVRRGMSAQDIADAAGIAVTLVRRLLRPPGRRPVRIARSTAEAVLGIPLPRQGQPPGPGRGLTGAHRAAAVLAELAELAAEAGPQIYLAACLDTSTATVAAVRGGVRRRISIALDQRIHHLQRHLADTTPTAQGIRASDAAAPAPGHDADRARPPRAGPVGVRDFAPADLPCCPVRVGPGLGGRGVWDTREMTSPSAERPRRRRPTTRTAAPDSPAPAAQASGPPTAVFCCRTWSTERLLPGGAVVATTWHEPACPAARRRR